MGGLIRSSMKFLSPEVALYVSKSTIRPFMEYCCHVWVGTPSRYLKLLSYQNGYVGLLVLHLLLLLNPWFIVERQPAYVFDIGITLVDVHLNWLNWSHCLILEEGLLVILIDYMIFLSPFLDGTTMSMSTVSFFAQLVSGILFLQNTFL